MRSSWIASPGLQRSFPSPPVLFLLYTLLALLFPYSAQATEPDFVIKGDPVSLSGGSAIPHLQHGRDTESYESDFLGLDRSIIGRADGNDQALANNAPGQLNIEQNDSQFWVFPKASLFGPKSPQTPGLPSVLSGQYPFATPNSSDERILYISITTCKQPTPKSSDTSDPPAQLELYVSTNSGNQEPSKAQNDHVVTIEGGFGWWNVSVKDDVYFGVSAPNNDAFDGIYVYQLTASIDGFYASYYNERNVFFVDSDTNSALLYTNDTTSDNASTTTFQDWMKSPPPFSVFVQNSDNHAISGMQNSVCALKNFADVKDSSVIDTGMTLARDDQPKQQFHVKDLNASSTYYAIVGIIGNSTKEGNGVVGGGGTIWNSVNVPNFKTKSDNNCALLFNLSFCTSVAYAAPANPNNFADLAGLAQKYDEYAKSQYKNFSYSLQQIPCDTTSSAQYSLARTCDDCDKAYREWLCAVTIPRCEDVSNNAFHLVPRNVDANFTNKTLAALSTDDPAFSDKLKMGMSEIQSRSRNPTIDNDIKPGPYKEVLPCEDLCYNLVQSCPASLQFVCPLEEHGLNYTYGKDPRIGDDGSVTCNYPGVMTSESSVLMATSMRATLVGFGVAVTAMVV